MPLPIPNPNAGSCLPPMLVQAVKVEPWRSFHLSFDQLLLLEIRREFSYMWGERRVWGAPVCETAMKVEWDLRLTRPSLQECVIWAWQWPNGIFLMNYFGFVSLKEVHSKVCISLCTCRNDQWRDVLVPITRMGLKCYKIGCWTDTFIPILSWQSKLWWLWFLAGSILLGHPSTHYLIQFPWEFSYFPLNEKMLFAM